MRSILKPSLSFVQRFIGDPGPAPARRHDLDWLRILAFTLLILFHVGMLYVADWGFHVKSRYSSETLQGLMLLVNPWRMPILWLVSGIAIRFVLSKIAIGRFVWMRSVRLLLPLLFAVLVIIPPQLFWEMTANGDLAVGYGEFYRAFLVPGHPLFKDYSAGILPHFDVNHLWYLRELWLFSMYLLFLLPVLNSRLATHCVDWLSRQHGLVIIGLLTIPIVTLGFAVENNREEIGFTFLVYGYLLGWHEGLWKRLNKSWRPNLVMAVATYAVLLVFFVAVWKEYPDPRPDWVQAGGRLIYGFSSIIWVLAMIGLGNRFLNRPSPALQYFNDGVYTYYILHQTIIIVSWGMLSAYELGPVLEPLLVLLLTVTGCALGFEIVRRVSMLRPFFGLKPVSNPAFCQIPLSTAASGSSRKCRAGEGRPGAS